MSDSLHGLFLSFKIERRSLVAARLKPAKSTPDTEAVEIRDQMMHNPSDVVEAEVLCAGVGETYVITLAVSIEEPHAPSRTAA